MPHSDSEKLARVLIPTMSGRAKKKFYFYLLRSTKHFARFLCKKFTMWLLIMYIMDNLPLEINIALWLQLFFIETMNRKTMRRKDKFLLALEIGKLFAMIASFPSFDIPDTSFVWNILSFSRNQWRSKRKQTNHKPSKRKKKSKKKLRRKNRRKQGNRRRS